MNKYKLEMAATPYTFTHIADYINLKEPLEPGSVWIGRVKIDGSNVGIVYDRRTHELRCQSRNQFIDPKTNHLQFYTWFSERKEKLKEFMSKLPYDGDVIVLYGEWCGRKIAKCCFSTLPDRYFIAFKVRAIGPDHDVYYDAPVPAEKCDMLFIDQFKKYILTVNRDTDNTMLEFMREVKSQCPVGKELGATGPGEGLVFTCGQKMFKVKRDVPMSIDKIVPEDAKAQMSHLDALSNGCMTIKEVCDAIYADTMSENNLTKYLYDNPDIKEYSRRIMDRFNDETIEVSLAYETEIKQLADKIKRHLHSKWRLYSR
jgi:RNA ligase